MRRRGGWIPALKPSQFFPTFVELQVLLALTTCCSGAGCSGAQKHMETVNKMGERPFVIAFRSYTGSRVVLLNAAQDLLTASGTIKYQPGGSDYEWYHDQERKHDFMATATLFKSDLPVEGILGMMAAVEERLGGPQQASAPLIKTDLLWVEGVEWETKELTLPSPLIFEKFWANSVFVTASEMALVAAHDAGREKASFARRVASAFKHFEDMNDPAVRFYFSTQSGGESAAELERKPGGTVYDEGATDDVDTLAIAGHLLLVAEQDVLRSRNPKTPKDEGDEDAYLSLQDVMEKLPRDCVIALQVATTPNASVDARAQAWVDGLAKLLDAQHFVGARTVIFSVGPTQISGAVLGRSAPEYQPFFLPGDAAVSSQRLADLPINRNAQEQARDNRLVKLSTLFYQRPEHTSK
jgi:hypothetical protein